MELIITSPKDNQFLKAIEFNYEALQTELKNRLTKYQNVQYDDTQIKDAKADRATLNKFKAALEARRKEIKARCLEPYEEFEKKIKNLVALVDQPILAIDTQVKTYEDKKKDDKRKSLEAFYLDTAKELANIVPFQRIFNERWLNATFDFDTATMEIFNAVGQIRKDLETLKTSVPTEFEVEVKDTYLSTLNLGEALRKNTYLQEQKKKLQEYQLKQSAVQAPAPASKAAQADPLPLEDTPVAVMPTAIDISENLEQVDFRVWVSTEQKAQLRAFLIENKIKYGKVKPQN